MPDIFYFALASLAVFRLSKMIATEQGPFDCFWHIRHYVALRFLPKSNRQHWIDAGWNCPKCLSFWLGFIFAIFLNPENVVQYVIIALAISAVTVLLVNLFG